MELLFNVANIVEIIENQKIRGRGKWEEWREKALAPQKNQKNQLFVKKSVFWLRCQLF